MLGCARRERRAHSLALATGWHAANFSRAKNMQNLGHYLAAMSAEEQSPADEAAAAFLALAERGLVTIKEVPKEP